MESALPILLFLGFLFGSCLLILICGIQDRGEDSELGTEDPTPSLDPLMMPRFFGRPGERTPVDPVAVVIDRQLVQHVEGFLRDELALAEVFLESPSPAGLQEQPETQEPRRSIIERLERFLRSEQRVAADFVSHPSVDRLHGAFAAPLPA